jgi:two-component system OmpR family response regulator
MRVLVIEDSLRLQRALERGLKNAGFAVDVVGDGHQGHVFASRDVYDVIVLDLMLPRMNGVEVLARLRAAGSGVHVLVLTARDAVEDRVALLSAGADDYLVKPFAFEELVARLRALTRRAHGHKTPQLSCGDLVLDMAQRSVLKGERAVPLTKRELSLFEFLALRKGKLVTRIEIEDNLYAEDKLPNSNAVEAALSTLRAKLADCGSTCRIRTRHGLGYVLEDGAT